MVIKHDAERELYRGVAPVEGTDFQGALHSYLVRSQQSEGVVRIDVALGDDGRVVSASGLLVEKLPDQDSAVFRDLFGDLAQAELAPVLAAAAAGELWGFPLRILESRALRFACRCSHERSLGVLAMVGAGELHELLDDQGGAELTCNFCMEVYHFDADDLRGLIKALEGDA
jgi:molecular chaperone Hsp33